MICIKLGASYKTVKRKKSGIQCKTAFSALKRLLANPKATEEVFTIISALSGPSLIKGLKRFAATDHGRYVLDNRIDLIDTLQDRELLAGLEKGSLGNHYLSFIDHEKLSPDGLVEASEEDIAYSEMEEDLTRFATRQRDSHDLWHTVTQYGRDELGELCLLAFTYAQTKNRGIGLIVLAGALKMRHYYGFKVFSAVFKAYRDSRKAKWLPEQNWEALLKKPIDAVRRELGIQSPIAYRKLLSNPAMA